LINGKCSHEDFDRIQQLSQEFSKLLMTKARNFLIYEWFYPSIDYGYFSKNEFTECLHDMNIHV